MDSAHAYIPAFETLSRAKNVNSSFALSVFVSLSLQYVPSVSYVDL